MPGFDESSCDRIAASTRWVEDRYRNAVPRGGRASPGAYNKIGVTTTSITARAGTTPGHGSVQPYWYDDVSGNLEVVADVAEQVLNWTGSAVAANVVVEYKSIDGWLFLCGQDCSGVAI